ncbi:hypothetical protein V6U90_22105 [Micromonospora sp. CPCC 206060]|uniref:hypothetical protein n=1 Tax=Micromonospora sp. CPCC 206060 TaxID=3122406 RepID=UPI002FF16B0C
MLLVFAGMALLALETPLGRPPVAVNLGVVVVLAAAILGSLLIESRDRTHTVAGWVHPVEGHPRELRRHRS